MGLEVLSLVNSAAQALIGADVAVQPRAVPPVCFLAWLVITHKSQCGDERCCSRANEKQGTMKDDRQDIRHKDA